VKLKPRGWFGARNALLRGRSKRSPRWRRLLWRFERSNSEVGRLRLTKAVACRRCLQLSFGRGYLLLQIFRDPGAQRPPKQGKLRHWVVVTVVVSRQLLAWHARYIHASIEEAGVDGGVERWWHPKGNNQKACRSRAEQPRACVPATRHDAFCFTGLCGATTLQGGKTDTVSDFLGEKVGQKTQKQGEGNLTDICKIRFLMAGSQRLVFALGRRLGGPGGPPRGPPRRRARGEPEKNGHEV